MNPVSDLLLPYGLQCGVVYVPRFVPTVKGLRIRLVERCPGGALHQVRVGDVELTKGDQVSLAGLKDRLGTLPRVSSGADQHSVVRGTNERPCIEPPCT